MGEDVNELRLEVRDALADVRHLKGAADAQAVDQRELAKSTREMSNSFIKLCATVDAINERLTLAEANQRKVGWYVFGLLITIIGTGVTIAVSMLIKG